jgi:hypothetical protein
VSQLIDTTNSSEHEQTIELLRLEQLAIDTNASLHPRSIVAQLIDISLALAPLALPPYVLLEIVDWLPLYAALVPRKLKIDALIGCRRSIEQLRAREQSRL